MKNPIEVIQNKRLTGVSTPFFGLSWEDKEKNLKSDSKDNIQIDYKIRVFISSVCGDHGRYDSLRKNLKDTIESTGIAQVYLFSDRPGTTTALNDYTVTVRGIGNYTGCKNATYRIRNNKTTWGWSVWH